MTGGPRVLEPHAVRPAWLARPDMLAIAGGALAALLLLGWADLPLAAGFAALWWLPVVVVVRSDLEGYIIPDLATLSILGLGLAFVGVGAASDGLDTLDVGRAVAGALVTGAAAFGLFWLVGRLYRVWSGREGLGFGDVKLAAALAIWLTPADGVVGLEIAALGALMLAVASRRSASVRDVAIPFGAFLAPAAWLVFVAGPAVRALLDP